MSLHDKNYEHFRALFEMIVQSCKQERLAIMRVKDKSSEEPCLAMVAIDFKKEDDYVFEAEVTPLAILLSPKMAKNLEPIAGEEDEFSGFEVNFDNPDIELDNREKWRPPTRGTL